MLFDNAYYLSDPLEQLKPQKLDSNVFFGPLNTLTQFDFIKDNNVKLFICIGLSTQRLANILNDIPALSRAAEEFLMVNFDPTFDQATLISANHVTQQYHYHNSSLLRLLIDHFIKDSFSAAQSDSYRCLTPTPETPDVNQLLYGEPERYYNDGNVCVDSTSSKYEVLNDLITIFRYVNPSANVLVFSQNGNDQDLLSFLISVIIKKNSMVNIVEAYQYIKSIRPTVNDFSEEALVGHSALLDFHELVRVKDQAKQKSFMAPNSPTPYSRRRRNDSISQRETPEPAEEQNFGSKRSRFD